MSVYLQRRPEPAYKSRAMAWNGHGQSVGWLLPHLNTLTTSQHGLGDAERGQSLGTTVRFTKKAAKSHFVQLRYSLGPQGY